MFDKYALRELLQGNVVTVVFEKVDGTTRRMRSTLMSEHLPQFLAEHDGQRPENPDVLAVWDMEKAGWRSFHVSSVKEVIVE
jgi:WYL_2, Sm-like SH3 beta-barrel fold